MNKNIAVVGAGIAGLTAAYYLKKFGYNVTVYEASNRVGGRMTTDLINDCLIDRGAQFLSTEYSTLMPLIQELGMNSELVEASPWVGIVRNHQIRKLSAKHFFSPLISGYLNLKEAINFLFRLRKWRSTILPLPLGDYAAWAAFDNEHANTFICREFGEYILEYMIEPQMQGFHYQSPEVTSKIHALMLLSFALKKGNVMNFRHGMGSLPEKLATYFDVKLNCPILSLKTESTGTVALVSNDDTFYADKVILATTATIGKSIFQSANDIENILLQTQYSSTINIGIATHSNWKLPRDLNNVYGILIPRRERQLIAGIGIESQKNAERIAEGELLDIMLDSTHGKILFDSPDDIILKSVLSELEKYFPGLSDSIRLSHIVRWKDAEPISSLGRSINIKNYKKTLNFSAKVILAGDHMGFPYTDSAAYTGKWAADFIIRAAATEQSH